MEDHDRHRSNQEQPGDHCHGDIPCVLFDLRIEGCEVRQDGSSAPAYVAFRHLASSPEEHVGRLLGNNYVL